MSTYSSTLRYLYGLQQRGMKFGLRNLRHLVTAAGNPHHTFPSIHIAGTNGKGSTAAFLASIFMEAKYKTALYTSPHLVRFTERIKINGIEIDQSRIVRYTEHLRPAIEEVKATFFEATTCMAFMYFADEGVDIAILEAGLGGRLDSTNVVHPLVSIITNVSYDHTEYLGNTLQSIAREKAGIIKTGVPCITGAHQQQVLDTISRVALRKRSPFYTNHEIVSLTNVKESGGAFRISMTSRHLRFENTKPGLQGIHQLQNAQTAVATVELILRDRKAGFTRLGSESVTRGLSRVGKNTNLHGRLEVLRHRERYILDVAHNPDGIKKLIAEISRKGVRGCITVFGVMADKNYEEMIDHLKRVTTLLITVTPKTKRALALNKLVEMARAKGLKTVAGGSVGRGLALAKKHIRKDGIIVVTGSHYVVGEAAEYLK